MVWERMYARQATPWWKNLEEVVGNDGSYLIFLKKYFIPRKFNSVTNNINYSNNILLIDFIA